MGLQKWGSPLWSNRNGCALYSRPDARMPPTAGHAVEDSRPRPGPRGAPGPPARRGERAPPSRLQQTLLFRKLDTCNPKERIFYHFSDNYCLDRIQTPRVVVRNTTSLLRAATIPLIEETAIGHPGSAESRTRIVRGQRRPRTAINVRGFPAPKRASVSPDGFVLP